MKDAIFGELQESGNALLANMDFDGKPVEINIDPENEPIDSVLEFAKVIAKDLSIYNKTAKKFAAEELLDTYNDNWRFYSTYDENNNLIDVEDPALSSNDLQKRISLTGINIGAENGCTFCYDDDNLFAGHSIFVTSFNGAEFSDLHAELFG